MGATSASQPDPLPNPIDPAASSLGAQLRAFRVRAGLSREALAERAGLGLTTLKALEGDRRPRPHPDTLARLAEALGLASAERDALLALASAVPVSPPDAGESPVLGAVGPSARRVRLPVPPTPLIGREVEVAEAGALLGPARRAMRLLTLLGPGGVGKTRLAVAVAASLVDAYADGVVFVDLAPLRDERLVPATIARALGVRESGGHSARDLLLEHLAERQVLLVLDNFEHLLGAAPLLAELLAACPRLALLVTSRTALRLRGEQRFSVPPLAGPADPSATDEAAGLAVAAASPAVRLFVERAQASAPDFGLDASNAAAVAAICRRLDGMPLAIELAAARVGLLRPEALLRRLEHRLPLLVAGAPDLPERQQTLRATLAWSHDLLDPAAQVLFRRLAVFAGGWTLEAAEAVCVDAALPAEVVLDGLQVLVDSSLVRWLENVDGEPRFGMLETVREYADERLAESAEAEATRHRQAAFYLALAERVVPALRGPDQVSWLQRLEHEHANLRGALLWLAERGDSEAGLRLAAAAAWMWRLRGHLREGREHLVHLLGLPGPALSRARAEALLRLAQLGWAQGDYAAQQRDAEASLAIFRNLADQRGTAEALSELGTVAFQQGQHTVARALLEESLHAFRTLDEPAGMAGALITLASVLRDQGDFAAAQPLYDECLALRRTSRDRVGESHVLSNLGWLALYEGDLAAARRFQEASLSIRRDLADRREAAVSQSALAKVAIATGELTMAHPLLLQSLAIHEELGNRWGLILALEGCAGLLASEQPERAVRLAGAAARLRTAIRRPMAMAEQPLFERWVATTRRNLAADVLSDAWTAGQAMSDEQAGADARAGLTAWAAQRIPRTT